MKGLSAINNIQRKYEDAIRDYVTRFLVFAHTYAAEFAVFDAEYADKIAQLMGITDPDTQHIRLVLGMSIAALGQLEKERLDSVDKEQQTSDYAIQIREFAGQGCDLHLSFYETNIAICKRVIKETKEVLNQGSKNRNLYYNNPKLKKARKGLEDLIKDYEERIILNQMELANTKLIDPR